MKSSSTSLHGRDAFSAREVHRHDGKAPEHLCLERAEESFDDRNAAALSDGAEARTDAAAAAPRTVVAKLRALVGDDVLRRDAGAPAGGIKEPEQRRRVAPDANQGAGEQRRDEERDVRLVW